MTKPERHGSPSSNPLTAARSVPFGTRIGRPFSRKRRRLTWKGSDRVVHRVPAGLSGPWRAGRDVGKPDRMERSAAVSAIRPRGLIRGQARDPALERQTQRRSFCSITCTRCCPAPFRTPNSSKRMKRTPPSAASPRICPNPRPRRGRSSNCAPIWSSRRPGTAGLFRMARHRSDPARTRGRPDPDHSDPAVPQDFSQRPPKSPHRPPALRRRAPTPSPSSATKRSAPRSTRRSLAILDALRSGKAADSTKTLSGRDGARRKPSIVRRTGKTDSGRPSVTGTARARENGLRALAQINPVRRQCRLPASEGRSRNAARLIARRSARYRAKRNISLPTCTVRTAYLFQPHTGPTPFSIQKRPPAIAQSVRFRHCIGSRTAGFSIPGAFVSPKRGGKEGARLIPDTEVTGWPFEGRPPQKPSAEG